MRKKIHLSISFSGNYFKKEFMIMKISILLTFLSLFQISAEVLSQNTQIQLERETGIFAEIIQAIEEQSEFSVFYKNEQVDLNRRVTMKSKTAKVTEVLDNSLAGTNMKYTVLDKVIVLSPKEEAVLIKQGIPITGIVRDKNGEPLPGVNVVEKDTYHGTITDIDGNYAITVSGPDAILVFSSMGFFSESVAIGESTTINISLVEDIVELDAVVVVGYGTVRKSDITGSVASIGTKEINQGTVNNPLEAMQGRAAGVDISSNNRPGELGSIRIRGERSIGMPGVPSANNEPLYVVDGVPMAVTVRNISVDWEGGSVTREDLGHNPIAHLNPNDIQSIEILKDASATAIYGSRAANGVVIITTKRGQSGEVQINYNSSYTFDRLDDRLTMFGAADQFEANRESRRNAGAYNTPYPDPENDWRMIGGQDINSWLSIAQAYEWEDFENRQPVMRPTTPEEQALWNVNEVPVYNPSNVRETDWIGKAVRTGITQNHQVSASMGTDKMQTYMSFGYLDQTGVQKTQEYTRYNTLLAIDMELTGWLKIGGTLNGLMANQEFGINALDMARGMLPFAVPYDPEGEYIWLPGGESTINNFLKDMDNTRNNRKTYHVMSSLYGEVDLFKGLKYRVNFGPQYRQYRNGTFQSAETAARWGSSSYARYLQDQSFNWTLDNLLYYNTTINVHSIGLTLLHSSEQYQYEYSLLGAEDLPYNEQLWYDLGSARTGVAKEYGSRFEGEQRESYMARLNYGLMDKYLLTLSGRYDGASVLSEDNKWQFFPAVAFAWKMKDESFLRNVDVVSIAKLRLGWGITGNSAVPPYQASGRLENWNYAFGSSVATGYRIDVPPNADLNWERTSQINIGYDFGLFRNRIYGSIDFYDANTYDLIMGRTIPVVNGAKSVWFNVGQTHNRGIELMISTVNIDKKDFGWRSDFTFSRNNNQIVELYSGKNDDVANRWFIGEPINVFYGYQYDGIWNTTPEDSALFSLYYGNASYNAGSIRVKDIDTTGGQYVINEFDRAILGSAYPDFIAGLTNYFTYKGFELSFFLYARVGQTIGKPTPTLYGRYHDIAVDYWTPTNTSGTYPRPRSGFSDAYMGTLGYQMGTFLKVRNISLVYNLPNSLISRANISKLALKVQLLNPFLFTNAEFTDPDMGNNATKSLVFGVNVGF